MRILVRIGNRADEVRTMASALLGVLFATWFFGACIGLVLKYEPRLFPDKGVVVPPMNTRQHARAILRAMAWPVFVGIKLVRNQ